MTLMSFRTTWLPNVVVGITSLGVGWVIGNYQAKEQVRKLDTVLQTLEDAHLVELKRDDHGRIVGGRVIRLEGGASAESSATGELTTHPRVESSNR
jgi:hypothetical protein